MLNRLLHPTDLPSTLWCRHNKDDCLVIPAPLCEVYLKMLHSEGLLEEAKTSDHDDGPVGGICKEDTRKHFSTRFSSSAARMQLAILDPQNELRNVPDLFLRSFSGGKVSLLDIPSGAGAASADLLATVAVLRESGRLPRQPLEVLLLAGDISEYARSYSSEMIIQMQERLEGQGIFVKHKTKEWDVLCPYSTSHLLYDWMTWAHDCREHFVVMANFSGFLQREGKLKQAQPQLDEVFRYAAQSRSTVIWLEPQTNTVTVNLLNSIVRWFTEKLTPLYKHSMNEKEPYTLLECKYIHPVKENVIPTVRLSLIRMEVCDS